MLVTLAERVKPVLEDYYRRTPEHPDSWEYSLMRDPDSSYQWQREGDPIADVVQGMLETSESIAEALIEVWQDDTFRHPSDPIEEEPFDHSAHYEYVGWNGNALTDAWSAMKYDVTHRTRYFSPSVDQFLGTIFNGLEKLQSADGRVIMPFAARSTIYRARVARDVTERDRFLQYAETELGAPPPAKVMQPGRMNAAGISVFYGGTDVDTCLGEVRPSVGGIVVVAGFKAIRDLRLVNLKALNHVYDRAASPFKPTFKADSERLAFLRRLCQTISAPVHPSDVALDYVITQVICEYLATRHPDVDGLMYPSTQNDGRGSNIVLFARSCHVLPMDESRRVSKILQLRGEGDDDEDIVAQLEAVSGDELGGHNPEDDDDFYLDDLSEGFAGWKPIGEAAREVSKPDPTLQLDREALSVLTVKGVKYFHDDRRVRHWGPPHLDAGQDF